MSLTAAAQQQPPQGDTLRDRDPDISRAKELAGDLQKANFHSGRVYWLSRFRIADAGYTESAYVPTGDTEGGLSFRVEAPQRLYFVPHRKIVLGASLTPGYNIFSAGQRQNRFDYLARADVHFLLNHLYLNGYTQRADQLRANVSVNQLAETREDETGVAGEFKYSSRTSAQFSARYRDTSFPGDRFGPGNVPLALLDRSERNGRVAFVHKTFPLTSLFIAAEGSNYGFRNATYKDSTRRWVGTGFRFDSGRSELRLEIGPAKLDFEDPTQRDFSGLIGNLAGTRSNGRWTYSAAAGRDVGFSIFAENNYYISDSASVGVDYQATRRLTLRANTAGQRNDYDQAFRGQTRRDTISFSSIGFTYALRKLSFGVDAGWYERDSTLEGDTDSGIRYVLHLSFTP
ncbi:MAG: outer membrane beta-barrel protein [Acidobacteriota bacterium]|nr:outer membrane beta-barrel protein [Acidobacteriota bacterium]